MQFAPNVRGTGDAAGIPFESKMRSARRYSVTMTEPQDDDRLRRYLAANPEFSTIPVPTPLDRRAALACADEHVHEKQAVDAMDKLRRLAVVHDLRESVPVFVGCLNRNEYESYDYERSAQALRAVARLGDPEQLEEARHYFHGLLRRADAIEHRVRMEQVCDAFGPGEGTKHLKEWIERAIEKLRAERRRNGAAERTGLLDNRLATLEEYCDAGIRRLERANRTRREIEALPSAGARITKLVDLYVDTGSQATGELSRWAALRLIRLTREDPSLGTACVRRLLTVARGCGHSEDPERQGWLNTYRARSLRAAEFFGAKLDDESRTWVDPGADPGVDVLALRPDWVY